MTIRICAAITASTFTDMELMMRRAERDGADLLEIRMDYLHEKINPRDIRGLSELPLIATNRPKRESGLFEGSEEERIKLLYDAANSGFNFVDIELSTHNSGELVQKMLGVATDTIISHHSFTSLNISTLNSILERELDTQAKICKIVCSAKTFNDNLKILKFVKEASSKTSLICFCMGEYGVTSRLLSPIVGGYLTYASVERGKESAIGQLTISEMQCFYDVLGV